ncbi:IS3 family transposase [Gemella haemolysans]|nr:IS3 family transposase [Gemella haemolysans]UBH82549.1 IS3 family transposase [Gemella haemolysans]UBH83180.1 IS3 family transposase [Gemella haemolysans]
MKLTDETKIEMYRLKKEGCSYKELSKKFKINTSTVKYIIRLADLHGETILIKGKNNYYPAELKLHIINEVLILGNSISATSLKYALPNHGLLCNWISKFKENEYNILEKPKGRPSKMKKNNKNIENKELSKVEQLEKELEYLRAENAVLKKLREIRLKQSQTKKKTKIVEELKETHRLNILLKILGLSRSSYYYTKTKEDKDKKNKNIEEAILFIQEKNKYRYGYRRITLELRNMGFIVNHKKVLRLTRKLGVLSFVRPTRKYNSYKGEIGKIADNIIARDFFASEPLKKCYTDVTQFKIGEDRVYLAPIIDGYNAEIIAYNISFSPNMEQQYEMLSQLQDNRYEGMILHSDQGWQYQHITYRQILKAKGIKQSMSRKGTSADNAFMESFFGVLKSEMYYGFEDTFKNKYELKEAIIDYIKYYNEERIKLNLGGLSPITYRRINRNKYK